MQSYGGQQPFDRPNNVVQLNTNSQGQNSYQSKYNGSAIIGGGRPANMNMAMGGRSNEQPQP